MMSQALRFISRRWPRHGDGVTVTVSPISGGLESAVARVQVESRAEGPSPIPPRFLIKELRGWQCREERVYRALWRAAAAPPAARVFGRALEGDACYLYLEELTAVSSWPWRERAVSEAVCAALARLHRTCRGPAEVVADWDYERELARSAIDTLALATTARDERGGRVWPRPGDLQRVVAALPQLRAALDGQDRTFIHGDVHPGNVLVTAAGDGQRVVFIDWGRARLGSPLEDVASWLHSLGCWEPEARRRHDSLLAAYLRAAGGTGALGPELRRRYWLASASNGLAGAIRYHVGVLADASAPEVTRANARQALGAWQRVIRRAAALLGR